MTYIANKQIAIKPYRKLWRFQVQKHVFWFHGSSANDASFSYAMAASNERASKQRKLNEFREGLPHCSQSALSAILQKVKTQGVPELVSQDDIKEAGQQLLESLDWYGPLWQVSDAYTHNGAAIKIAHINALSLIAGLYNAGGCFTKALDMVHSKSPSSRDKPWRMILYSDEVHPGHQLSSGSRKVWAIYLGFLEYGQELHQEELWLPLLICRSSIVGQLASSIGQCFKLVLEAMFSNPMASPLTGVRLKHPNGKHLVLHWTVSMFLQDGSAHKFTFSNKQDAGSRVCMMCKNLFLAKGFFIDADGDEQAQPTLANFTRIQDLDLAADNELVQSWQRMKERSGTVSKSDWKTWCQVSGIDYTPHALLLSAKLNSLGLLKPATQYCHDFMHCLCSKGCLSFVTFWVLEAICFNGMSNLWETLQSYLQLWTPPASFKAVKPHLLFLPKNVEGHKASKYIKCSASEMLSLHRPLAYFIHSCCLSHGFLENECRCFLAWSDLLDFLASIPFLQEANPQHLAALVEKALHLVKICGWGDRMRPKMHWPLHWPSQLQHFKALPACWCLERKHKAIRRYGGTCCNMQHYDEFVMRELLAAQYSILSNQHEEIGTSGCSLLRARKPDKKLHKLLAQHNLIVETSNCLYATSCRLPNGMVASLGDIIFFTDGSAGGATPGGFPYKVGSTQAFLQFGTMMVAMVMDMPCLEYLESRHAVKCMDATERISLVQCRAIVAPVTYSRSQGRFTCLIPAHLKEAARG